MKNEGEVKKKIRQALVDMGLRPAGGKPVANPSIGWFYMPANNGMGVSGLPDFMGIYRGQPFGIEAKGPGGRLSALQADRASEMQAAGARWFLVDHNNVSTLSEIMEQQ